MKVIDTERVPIKMWLDDIENEAMGQAKNLANLPFIHKWVAIMPDSHKGYGMPIGGVIATKEVVIPNAVGLDIACGMCAVNTYMQKDAMSEEQLRRIVDIAKARIPVGFKHQTEAQKIPLIAGNEKIVSQEYESASYQMGTLGGGNHFIEIQADEDDTVWIMIHSGSRNLGKKVAEHYNKVAIELNRKWHSQVPEKWELAFLPIDSPEGKAYMQEMEYCVGFAFENRSHMMGVVKDAFREVMGLDNFSEMVNIAHNYAAFENHYGQNVIVHRKGATRAREGQLGIIPGSMGTPSYIVRGLGNPQSFESCSHGAGRTMGRGEAIRSLNLEEEIKKLDSQGIIHDVKEASDLDEAPGSYKDIDTVMENQKDLVEIVTKLKPLAAIKDMSRRKAKR